MCVNSKLLKKVWAWSEWYSNKWIARHISLCVHCCVSTFGTGQWVAQLLFCSVLGTFCVCVSSMRNQFSVECVFIFLSCSGQGRARLWWSLWCSLSIGSIRQTPRHSGRLHNLRQGFYCAADDPLTQKVSILVYLSLEKNRFNMFVWWVPWVYF